ncbi:MAG: aldo/keto reductase [Alistipes sp.]|nr:aldo/keto reductase [Alistipes sp.]
MRQIFAILAFAVLLAGCTQSEPQGERTDEWGVPYAKLNNGVEMPRFGLGTFGATTDYCKQACLVALKAGYRHIDTAHAYYNEQGVGEAIKESGVPREQIWVTSKLWPTEYGEGETLRAIDNMLERLGLEYIDLLYIHQPIGDYIGAWKDMERAYEQGKVRALGISNCDAKEDAFTEIVEGMKIKPAVHQIECHPYAQRLDMRKKHEPYGIVTECWFPLGHGDEKLLSDATIATIAQKHGKTIAQIILRWHIQEGFSVIPGNTNPIWIRENIAIFDFELDAEDMATMRALNQEKRFYDMSLEQLEKFVFDRKRR